MLTSYAQNFEDVLLWRALGHVEKGFYIDIGAQDPVIDSVSLAFYEKGWRGVHVEPTPAYAQALRSARPDETVLQIAIGSELPLIPIYEIAHTGLSTGDENIAKRHAVSRGFESRQLDVPCISLAALLDRYSEREIHWLKIDVEGMEESVLRSWKPSLVRPWVVVVEATWPNTRDPSHASWDDIILAQGYRFVHFDGLNRFYVADSHQELQKLLASPPTVLDGIALPSSHPYCAAVGDALKETNARAAALEAEKLDLAAKLQALQSRLEDFKDAAELAATLAKELEPTRTALAAAVQETEVQRQASSRLHQRLQEREAQWNAQAESAQIESAKLQRDLTRRLTLKSELAEERYRQIGTLRQRHAAQVATYLQQIELAHERLQRLAIANVGLTPRRPSQRLRIHWRFAGIDTRRLIDDLLSERRDKKSTLEQIMDAPLITHTNYQPVFVVSSEGEYQLSDFLSLHDRNFVSAAYTAILHRSPDADGERHYLQQVRAGESKARLLDQILRSAEARKHRTVIHGLATHLRITRMCELPVLGRVFSAVLFLANVGAHLRDLRVLENHVIRIAEEAQALHESNIRQLHSMLK